MQTFDCHLVSAKDPNLGSVLPFDFVPRIGDLVGEPGRAYRVLDVYVVLSQKSGGRDRIYLSVESVAMPKVFADIESENNSDEDK